MSEEKGQMPDLSGILSQITANPKALSMLGALLNSAEMPKKEEISRENDCDNACHGEICPPRRGACFEDRKRLLLALKPFLSTERCQTVDMLLLVLEAFSAFRGGKG